MKNKHHTSPRIASIFLYYLMDKNDRDFLIGDFEEFYQEIKEEKGTMGAAFWYWKQAIISLPHFIRSSLYWRLVMIRSYMKIAFRNFRKNKLYFSLNVAGMALGLSFFLIAAFELDANYHFDTFHQHADRIFGLVKTEQTGNQATKHLNFSPAMLKPSLEGEFPELEDITRFYFPGETVVRSGENVFVENKVVYCDPEFLSLFTFPLLSGNKDKALSKPDQIILTRETAYKYFGNENPVGKTLKINKSKNFIISGVLKNPPKNSSLRFDFLIPLNALDDQLLTDKNIEYFATFFRLAEGYSVTRFEEKLPAFMEQHYPGEPNVQTTLYAHPLLKFHLHATHIRSFLYRDTPFFFFLGLGTVFLFLIVVCFNFMSLSIAQYINRGKEVVMRKVVGANRGQLIRQFLGESLLVSILSLPLAILLFEWIKAPFYTYFNNYYDLSLWARPWPLLYALLATVIAGFVSGCYPAFYLSKFQPVKVLKGNLQQGKGSGLFRKSLIVVQFSISVLLIIFSLTIKKQFDFFMNMDLGYDREQIIVLPIQNEQKKSLNAFQKQLGIYPDVEYVSGARSVPLNWHTPQEAVPRDGSNENTITLHYYGVDYNFVETLNIPVLQGRSFSEKFNESNSLIITRSALEKLDWQQPLGKELTINGKTGTVIGVTENFHFSSPLRQQIPAALFLDDQQLNYIFVKVQKPLAVNRTISHIENKWKAFFPDVPIEIYKLDNWFEISINGMERMANVFGFVGFMTIAISCIGLFALAAYSISRRTKEIGIRKVLGATTANISVQIIGGFLKLVVIANLIAWPLAWFGINQYLNMSANRIDTPVDIIILVTFLSIFIAITAVLAKTVNTARSNPVESLKYE